MLEIPVPYWTFLGPLGVLEVCYMNTDLGQDSIDQLTFRQQEIKIMVIRKDVAKEKCHPDLGHVSEHDPYPPSCHAPCKVLSRGA